MMKKKLGLTGEELGDENLIIDLLTWMHKNRVDYTNTFNFLTNNKILNYKIYNDQNFINWKKQWEKRLKLNNNSPNKYQKLMRSSNPAIIPRNHNVEDSLKAASENNDLTKIQDLLKALQNPYIEDSKLSNYQSAPKLGGKKYKTFCGT